MKLFSKSIVALKIISMKVFHATASEDAAVPLVITEKRLLNTCETFEYDGVGDWRVDGTGQTLEEACDPISGLLDCCNDSGVAGSVNVSFHHCKGWNKALPYTICHGACKGQFACWGIAANAKSGSVLINSEACKQGSACNQIGYHITGHLDVEIGSFACDSPNFCLFIGWNAFFLNRIEVPPNQCREDVIINGVTAGKCTFCGKESTFTGEFVATDECCEADRTYYNTGTLRDEVCTGSHFPSNIPSSIPSNLPSYIPSDQPSSIPSSSPSKLPSVPPVEPPSPCANQKCNDAGKCEVTSATDFKCVCEATFRSSENRRNCVCPPGFIRKSDNRCYDSTTPSPIPLTKAPTTSPVIKAFVSSSPSKVPTDEIKGCKDNEDAEFFLIQKPDRSVDCTWLTKNKDRASKRIENYCALNRVKTICKSTCSFCTCADDDSFTFEMINSSDSNKKNKTCNWLTANKKNREKRIARYCSKNFDGGAVMNACTKSCGLCK